MLAAPDTSVNIQLTDHGRRFRHAQVRVLLVLCFGPQSTFTCSSSTAFSTWKPAPTARASSPSRSVDATSFIAIVTVSGKAIVVASVDVW